MARPSVFAVLRLIASSYLVGDCTGRSAGRLALQDTIDIARRRTVQRGKVDTVGHQTAGCDVGPVSVDRWNRKPRCKRDDQVPMHNVELVCRHHQSAVGFTCERSDNALKLSTAASLRP